MNTSTLRGTLLDLECFLPVEHSSSVCAFGFEGKTSEEECDILCTALMAALSLPSACPPVFELAHSQILSIPSYKG